MRGTYRITMVLPAWTVENLLTLEPLEGGELGGCLDTLDGNPRFPSPMPAGTGSFSRSACPLGRVSSS